MSPIIVAKHLVKRFNYPSPLTILEDISLEVDPKQTIAIVGKSGEGKTTLLHILGTLEPFNEGSLEICGVPVSSQTWNVLRNEKIGFVFQSYNLLEEYTVLENILMPARIGKKQTFIGSKIYREAFDLIEEVGLLERANTPAKLLSGGEKQRTAIARALINAPALILADEPSGNLDHTHSLIIYNLLLQAATKRDAAVVVVTHDKELANRCETIYSLTDKKLSIEHSRL